VNTGGAWPRESGRARPSAYRGAIIANLVAVVCWAAVPTAVKALGRFFPVNFQNAWRYLVSLLVLWPAYFLTADRSRIRADLAEVRRLAAKIALIACAQYAFQSCFTFSLTLIYPAFMTLIGQTQAIFGVALAFAFFPDERSLVRDRWFLAGAALAIAGVVLVVLGGGGWGHAAFNVGVLAALGSALAWALMSVLIRAWVPHVPPLLAISSVFTILVPLFLASYVVANRGLPIPPAPAIDWVLMVVSGLVGVGLAQSLFYRAVPVIGVATSTSLGLLLPFLAAGLSWLVYGERLSAVEIFGGALLVSGSWFIIRLRLRASA
jgi:drug/metabolite transporter (DMT)-like permease